MLALHGNNILVQLLQIGSVAALSVEKSVTGPIWSLLFRLTGLFAPFNILGICLINIAILQTFSVLLEWVTEQRLKIWCLLNLGIYAATYWPSIANLVSSQFGSALFSCMAGYAIFILLIDNFQSIGLAIVVFAFAKQGGKKKTESRLQFRNAIMFSLALIVLDWLGVAGLFVAYYTDTNSPLPLSMMNISLAISGMHCGGIVVVFQKLKHIAVTQMDRKDVPKSKKSEKGKKSSLAGRAVKKSSISAG